MLGVICPSVVHGQFVHPGGLHTQADFDRMKAKVLAGQHPWIDSWNILINNSYAQSNYTPHTVGILVRGTGNAACSTENYWYAYWDTAAAYQLALRWKITGDNNFANAATNILNQWALTCTNLCGDPNAQLLEIYGYQFACVGEIMRSYTNWTASDVAQFQNWMSTVWYPDDHNFLTYHDGTCSTYIWANWDLLSIASMMSIGILCDNTNYYNEALTYFKSGMGCGNIEQTVYLMHPGYLGQGEEEGRDQGHSGLEVSLLGVICQLAYNQGNDLFAYENNRVLALCEYFAKYNLGNNVPYVTFDDCNGDYQPVISANSRGDTRPAWDLIYNHYVNLKGLAAPWSAQYAALVRPEGGGGNYGPNSGGYDQLGFTTLTASLDPITLGADPGGLTAILNGQKQVQLSWWGTANATNYLVKRGTAHGGPYTPIATITTNLLTYTDTNVMNSVTYYYTVSALSPLGESDNATEAAVSVFPRLVAFYKFDETSGTNAADATGNGWTGTLRGSATWAAGHSNDAVYLNGSSQYVSLPASLTTNLADFTMATWVYLNSVSTWMRIFDFGVANTNTPERYMFLSPKGGSGVVRFAITTGGGGAEEQINGTAALATGGWHHVAVTLNGNKGVLYVDGVAVGATNGIYVTPQQLGTTTQNGIGRSQWTADPYLNGKVDDFRIYSGALTATQVAALAAGYPSQPPAPTNVMATAVSANQINLSWSPSVLATNYLVERATASGGPYTVVSAPLTVTNFSDTGLNGGTTYYYIVAAVNDGGTTNSAQVSATTPSAPSAPASLTAAAGLSGAISLSWPASAGATSYNVKRANFSGGPYTVVATNITLTGYTNAGLYGTLTYFYVVSAANANGESLNSPEASATVPPIIWQAGANNNWDTGATTNWLSGGAPATYQDGCAVQFNDGAPATNVNLAVNVSPISVTFSNQTQNYTINSSGGFGLGGPASLTTLGSGSVTLNTSNTFSGGVTVGGSGTLTIGGAGNLGGGNYAGNVFDNSTLIYNSTATQTWSGIISGPGGLTKGGSSTLTLSGANTFGGATTVGAGTLSIPAGGQIASAGSGGGNYIVVGNTAGQNALLNIAGGSVNLYSSGNAWASYLQVGSGANDRGFVNLTSGTFNPQRHLVLGNNGGFGAMTMSGGTLTIGSYFILGFNQSGTGGNGIFNQTGGAVAQYQTSGNGATLIGSGNGSVGLMNLSGGTFDASAGGIFLPENGASTGTLNISGTAAVTAGNAGVKMGNSASAVAGTLNLLGGTLTANLLQYGGGKATVNFNGGTLRASGASTTFMQGLSYAYVYGSGGTIDNSNNNITLGQPLLTPAGSGIVGVSNISVANQGAGYLNAPIVTLSGGTLSTAGATAIANLVDDGTGHGTYKVGSITVTSPGRYTVAPTSVTLTGGGAGAGASGFTVSTSANTSGGMTFVGAGTTTLSGVNTYTGPTTVGSGTLKLNGTVLPAASPVTLAAGATLDLNGFNSTIAGLNGGGVVDSSSTNFAVTLTVSNSSDAVFSGVMQNSGQPLAFVKTGGGAQSLNGTNTYSGATTLSNGTLLVNGVIGTNAVTVAGGTLSGVGKILGPVTVQSGGILAPGGTNLAALVVNSDVTLLAGSLTQLAISKTQQTNAPLWVTGTLACGGTLVVTNLSGTLAGGDRFQLFQAGSVTGSFSSNSLPVLGSGLAWNTARLSSGWLSVVQTTTTHLLWSASGTNLNLAWPAACLGWRLQTQTNPSGMGLGSNWWDVSSSTNFNQLLVPIDVSNANVFFRLVYP